MACETNIILAQEVFYWYSTQRYGFASAPISNGGYRFLFIMHMGAYDDEPATVALMDAYLEQKGYVNDINKDRLHHEIYMSDARKVAPEKWKTVIRHPIRKL